MVILNERQYRIAKAQADKFRAALDGHAREPAPKGVHPKLRKAEREAMTAQLRDLEEDLAAYEALRAGTSTLTGRLEDIGGLLIAARIARQWSQQELADRIGVKMQQVQRYEATRYASAKLDRLLVVAQTLGLTASLACTLIELPAGSPADVLKRAAMAGAGGRKARGKR